MDSRPLILIFGNSVMLGTMGVNLRASALLHVIERQAIPPLGERRPDMILVDAAQVTPEQFRALILICPAILSIDPETYQLSILSMPHHANPPAEMARLIGILSLSLQKPA